MGGRCLSHRPDLTDPGTSMTSTRPCAGFFVCGRGRAETTRNPAVTPVRTDGPAISRKSGFLPRYPRRFPRNRPRNQPIVDGVQFLDVMKSTRDSNSLPWPGGRWWQICTPWPQEGA